MPFRAGKIFQSALSIQRSRFHGLPTASMHSIVDIFSAKQAESHCTKCDRSKMKAPIVKLLRSTSSAQSQGPHCAENREKGNSSNFWDAATYMSFSGMRTRAAVDLINGMLRFMLQDVSGVAAAVDLGCGAGNSTELLRTALKSDCVIHAVDNAPSMLKDFEIRSLANVKLHNISIEQFELPERSVDVIFSNAALHWIDDHPEQLARLSGMLSSAGVLAVQMPTNFDAPSHRLVSETIAEGPWSQQLMDAYRHHPVLSTSEYHSILCQLFEKVDVWETTYWHCLEGNDPVLRWTRGSTLVPIHAALNEEQIVEFEEAYGAKLREAYPPREDGVTLFPFRRLFCIARYPKS